MREQRNGWTSVSLRRLAEDAPCGRPARRARGAEGLASGIDEGFGIDAFVTETLEADGNKTARPRR